MALRFGGATDDQPKIDQNIVLAWQRFLTVSPWEAQDVQQELQAVFNEEFVPTASRSPIGTVGVIDGSGFVKRGTESVGVQRQWCGRLGKRENCQVGVFLAGCNTGRYRAVGSSVTVASGAGRAGGRSVGAQRRWGAAGTGVEPLAAGNGQ